MRVWQADVADDRIWVRRLDANSSCPGPDGGSKILVVAKRRQGTMGWTRRARSTEFDLRRVNSLAVGNLVRSSGNVRRNMETIWRWFYRCVVGVGVLFGVFSILLVVGMNRPHVTQSNGFTSTTPEAVSATLSRSLPRTATNVHYCRASVGMGGRILIYRFAAPVADLHAHALTEFAAHWDKPQSKSTSGSASPITEYEIQLYESGFGIECDWLLPPANAVGTLYESADGQFSHRPTIFVDETNEVLYFRMAD